MIADVSLENAMTAHLPFLLTMSLITASAAVAAERPPIIPVTEFFDNPKISSAEISPDGKRFAFLAPEENRMNVFVCEVGEDFAKAKAVTHDRKRGIFSFAWTRDGAYVLYEQDQGGNENFHLYRVNPLKPEEPAKDLTPQEGARADIIDLPREHPDEALISLNARDKKYFDVYQVKISTGEQKLVETNPGDVDSWYADAHGVIRACAAQVEGGKTQIRVRDTGEGPFRTLGTYTDEEDASIQAFTEDGKSLYFTDARGSNTTRLVNLDIASGKETVLAQNPNYDIGNVIISDKTRKLLAVAFNEDKLVFQSFDPQFSKDLAALEKVHDGEVLFRNSDNDERKWIIAFNSPTDPGATYLYDRNTGEAKFLYRPRPWLKSNELVGMKPISFKSRDGLDIHGYLSLPKGVAPKDLPTVLVVHGGPWARDDWGYDPEVQFLANRGFAVLQINFRGSTGYGKDFLHAGDKEWGGKMLNDLVDGVNWIVGQGIADKKRVGIYGGSYGGYATLSALAFQPDVFACGVDYVGISNLLTFMKTIPPYWETFRDVMYRRVGNPETDQALLRSRSPLFSADKIKAPLFIAQGYNDPRVNHAEAEQIVAALKKNGHPVEYMVKMDEGHGFENPENRIDFYTKMEAFLADHLMK
jgi:dipeptidyl aminopeptidase/acylaminoacyl peptidase